MHVEAARQARAFRLLTLAQNVAKIGAPAAGAWVGVWLGDDRTIIVSLILILGAIVLMSRAVPDTPGSCETLPANDSEALPQRAFTRAIAPLLLCAGIVSALRAAVNNPFPLMLKHQGFAPSVLGFVVSCAALGGVLGSLIPTGRREETRSGIAALLMPGLAICATFVAIGGIFRLPTAPGAIFLGIAFFASGFAGARLRVGCRMFIARRLSDQVAGAGATLQSTTLFVSFVAPCIGALLMSCVSTSHVFVVLGSVSALCLAGVALYFGRDERAHRRPVQAGNNADHDAPEATA